MEENCIKKLNRIIKVFVIAGISLAVLLLVVDKAELIDFRGEFDYSYGSKREHCESLKNSDVVLPYKYNNLLSAKEGILTETIRNIDNDRISKWAFHPDYEWVDDRFVVFYDGIKKRYGITDGKGNWIIEPKYQRIRTDHYEEYGVLVFEYSSVSDEGSEVVDGNLKSIVSGYPEIYVSNGKIIVKEYDEETYSDRYGLCNLNGDLILEPKYKDIDVRKDNLIDVTDENGEHRLLDSEGKELYVGENMSMNADDEN